VRSLPFHVGDHLQVSMNLVDPAVVGPAQAYDEVVRHARALGTGVERAEMVGLLPEAVLAAAPKARWAELDLDPDRTIEARLGGSR
jgi:glutamate formiminotransferase